MGHSSAFKFSLLHYRGIQLRYIDHLKQGNNYNDLFSFDDDSMEDLSWSSSCPHNLTLSFIPFSTDPTIYIDASRKSWEACLSSGFSGAGIWPSGFDYHINHFELTAIYNGLLASLPYVKYCAVKIMSDNICAVFHINKLRGTHSP